MTLGDLQFLDALLQRAPESWDWAQLRVLARLRYDFWRLVHGWQLRARHWADAGAVARGLEYGLLARIDDCFEAWMAVHPFGRAYRTVPGMGIAVLSILLMHVGDITRFRSVGALWNAMGVGSRLPSPAHMAIRRRWLQLTHLLGPESPYRQYMFRVYHRSKEWREAGRGRYAGASPSRLMRWARYKTVRLLLSHAYEVACHTAGVPFRPPYSIRVGHYYTPLEFGWAKPLDWHNRWQVQYPHYETS